MGKLCRFEDILTVKWGRILPSIAVVAGLGLTPGCSKDKTDVNKPSANGDNDKSSVDTSLCEMTGKGKEIVEGDGNGDDKPDVWKIYKIDRSSGKPTRILTCQLADLDYDGKKDLVVGFADNGAKLYEKVDLTWEGTFDALYKYQVVEGEDAKSVLYEVRRSTSHNGRFDTLEKYDKEGVLKTIQRDTNGDDKPDVWEQYEHGKLKAILTDKDYDGKVDTREEDAEKKPKKQPKKQPTDKPAEAPPEGEDKTPTSKTDGATDAGPKDDG